MRVRMVLLCVTLLAGVASADDSLNVRLVGACELPLTIHSLGVAVSGDYAYLSCRGDQPDTIQGLYVISIADPTQPVEVGYCYTPGHAQDVTVVGDYAYVADDTSGLRVVSIVDPAHPVEVGYCDTIGRAMAVTVDGDYAYVASTSPGVGLWVISIADPTHPVVVGHCDTIGSAGGVALRGGLAYVGASNFSVISVADPAHPVVVGELQGRGGGYVALSGYYAYAGGLVIRVADPTHPIDVGTTGNGVKRVAVAGDHAYAAAGSYGMEVFSLADPGNPLMVGYYRKRYRDAEAVALAGAYVYVANDYYGLQILQYNGEGVEEGHKPQATIRKSAASVLSGASGVKRLASSVVFDAMGRRVLNLRSGVFFVRERSAAGGQRSAVTKVIISR